jgi:hypothetical protein
MKKRNDRDDPHLRAGDVLLPKYNMGHDDDNFIIVLRSDEVAIDVLIKNFDNELRCMHHADWLETRRTEEYWSGWRLIQ